MSRGCPMLLIKFITTKKVLCRLEGGVTAMSTDMK